MSCLLRWAIGNGLWYETEVKATGRGGVVEAPSCLTGLSDFLILVLSSPIRKVAALVLRDAVLLGRLTRRAGWKQSGRQSWW